jgi:hypothetical protein
MPSDITITPIASGHAFTRNPIMLDIAEAGQRVFMVYGQGYTSEHPAYKGEITAPATINLAEFIEAIVPPIDDPGENGDMISYGLQDGNITIYVDDGREQYHTWQFIAHHGGVSKQNFRKLNQARTDIFAARFLNPACNFFLTTRTNDWRLNIKETELYPLIFFYPLQGTLAVNDIVGGNTVTLPAIYNEVDYHGKLCSLDLKAVRKHFLDEYECIPAVFDILVDGAPAARIAIQEAQPQRERYRLKFRNSFDAFEIIEITGPAEFAPAFDGEDEASQYKRYQDDLDDFATERQRASMTKDIKMSSGYKTNNELQFLIDAIASEEVYLLGLTNEPIKVIVTADELTYHVRPSGPQAFDLTLTPVDSDTCITPEMTDDLAPSRGNIFSKEFDEHFD